MTTPTAAKKDIQKLQRAIVDALEDVKAQDIVVFDTEHLSPLFERVVVASGTSNRQTKALAASVRDAVRDAGFAKPRVEGEANGEWIIVDCGQAVVHIMQPSYRQYYHLEELWGDKPVRLKLGAAKPIVLPKAAATPAKPAAKVSTSLKRSNAAKKGVQEAFPSKAELKKRTAAKAPPAKSASARKPAAQPASASKAVAKPAAKPLAKPLAKPAAKKAVASKVAAKKTPAKKATSRKA
ncbi:MAG: ribosome silencing factor [Burkholderiales bacterium]|nr:ribosome silencing factor [Burkholderiales bacterium]